jgi:hypothetical protein
MQFLTTLSDPLTHIKHLITCMFPLSIVVTLIYNSIITYNSEFLIIRAQYHFPYFNLISSLFSLFLFEWPIFHYLNNAQHQHDKSPLHFLIVVQLALLGI